MFLLEWLESLIGRLIDFALDYGVIGLALGMFFESIGIPATSVVLELTSGTLISEGRTTFLGAVFISTTGLVAGSTVSYYLGYFGVRFVGFFRADAAADAKKSRAHNLLIRHGDKAILFAQLFGATRTWISIPAGAMGLNFPRFILYTAIGGAIYCSIAVGLSVALTDIVRKYYRVILTYQNIPFIIGFIALVTLVIMWFFKKRKV